MARPKRLLVRCLLGAALVAGLPWTGAGASMDVTLDAETIGELLDGFVPSQVQYPLIGGRPVRMNISDVRVIGFDPAAGPGGKGEILTSLRLEVPELRLSTPVRPRVSLEVEQVEGEPYCMVRFNDVKLEVPVIGAVDISRTIPPFRIPADYIYPTRGGRGDVDVRTRLIDVTMGTTAVRFRFDVTVTPSATAP